MNIIIDSNELFSALIKDSITRKIILEYASFFLFPSFIFEEMQKHKTELLKKSRMSGEDFSKLLQLILKKVVIVPNEVLIPYRKEAFEIVKNIDPDDVLFVACALAYHNSIIWSNDRKLKKQSRVKVLNTKEIIKLLQISG
ncbi:PIN domain-containing protein [Candidatus Woesearchaeota archaeon]|nr:PIN domain-containing protein [Candidatus Woesearchaeota archaeon]